MLRLLKNLVLGRSGTRDRVSNGTPAPDLDEAAQSDAFQPIRSQEEIAAEEEQERMSLRRQSTLARFGQRHED